MHEPLPVFYINLDSRPDRRAFMQRQFDALGIDAIRVPGRIGIPVNGLSAAQVGCSASHAAVWERIADGSAPAGVVFEDDALISPELKGLLRDPTLRADWFDVLRLETRMFPARLGRSVASTLAFPFSARRLLSPLAGSTGYIISRRAGEALQRSPAFRRRPIDDHMFGLPSVFDMRIVQVVPAPVVSLELQAPERGEAESDTVGTFRLPPSPGPARRLSRRLAAVLRYPLADTILGLNATDIPFCGDT